MFHLARLPDPSLANMVFKEQMNNSWPGLVNKSEEICEEIGMEMPYKTTLTKTQYKREMTRLCRIKDDSDMKNIMKNMTKCKMIMEDDFKVQDYISMNNLHEGRECFRIKTAMNDLRGNFPNKVRKEDKGFMLCSCKMTRETSAHVMECSEYDDIREDLDLCKDQDLIMYFRRVMRRRQLDK